VASISTDENGMPAQDLEFRVEYFNNESDEEVVEDTEPTPTPTPGQGGEWNPILTPIEPEPERTPLPIVTPEPTTAPQESVDHVITPDESGDGGYDITPVVDPETPLANIDLHGDHKCCILHFLIMLVSLMVLIAYTRSRKKRQARIFELKEQIEIEMIKRDLNEENEGTEEPAQAQAQM
jgi:hypothetical protein